jgi:hypothetical protein
MTRPGQQTFEFLGGLFVIAALLLAAVLVVMTH